VYRSGKLKEYPTSQERGGDVFNRNRNGPSPDNGFVLYRHALTQYTHT